MSKEVHCYWLFSGLAGMSCATYLAKEEEVFY